MVRVGPGLSGLVRSGNSSVGRASAFQAEGREFEPRFPLQLLRSSVRNRVRAHVAQLVEHLHGKQAVSSSNLLVGSISTLVF